MLHPGTQPLIAFRTTPWTDVRAVLRDAVQQSEKIAAALGPGVNTDKFLERLKALQRFAENTPTGNPLIVADTEILHLLEVEIVRAFLANPADADLNEYVAGETLLLTAATATAPTAIPTYFQDEFTDIIQGKGQDFYNNIVFTATLRSYLDTRDDINEETLGTLLLTALPTVENSSLLVQPYQWDGALIVVLMLQVLWKTLAFLPRARQQSIIQNFFYTSIVLGVPVRLWLKEALELSRADGAFDDLTRAFIFSFENSQEMLADNNGELQPFNALVKDYLGKVYNEQIDVLAQEQYLVSFYKDEKKNSYPVAWLREALNIILHIRKGDLT